MEELTYVCPKCGMNNFDSVQLEQGLYFCKCCWHTSRKVNLICSNCNSQKVYLDENLESICTNLSCVIEQVKINYDKNGLFNNWMKRTGKHVIYNDYLIDFELNVYNHAFKSDYLHSIKYHLNNFKIISELRNYVLSHPEEF